MIGQQKLIEKLNSFTLSTLPHSILLLGEEGCGKHTIIKALADKFSLDIVEINENVTSEDIIDYRQDVLAKIYIINLFNFTEKQQNQFLKFIEEPTENNYIFLIAESEIGILPTILNRCQVYHFEDYTEEELKQVYKYDNDLVYKVCRTPGKLKDNDIKKIISLNAECEELLSKIASKSYTDILSTITKINCKEEYDKFDFNTFFNMLEFCAYADYLKNMTETSYVVYNVVSSAKQKLIGRKLAKEQFLVHFFDELWSEVRKVC